MDKKELYCNSIMANINDPNYLLPYFASKENQTIYVMVPTTNPMVLHQSNENLNEIKKCSSEEEILPDFRCKVCSVTMFNYSEFKIHQQGHEKITQKILKKSVLADRIKQLRNLKYRLKSSISKNIANSTIVNVKVPATNPTVPHQLNKNFDEIKNCSSEEEISSDFRCEICSVTIFNYSEFKIHQQGHERITKAEVARKKTSITNCEFKTSDTELISTGLKEPLKANNGKNIVPFFKSLSDSSTLQSHIEALSAKTNTKLVNSSSIGIVCKSQVEKYVNKTTGTFKRILPASQSHQRNMNSFLCSSDSKHLTSVKESTKSERVEYGDNNLRISPNSITLKKSSDIDFLRHSFEKGVNQITNELNSSQVSFKLLGNMDSYTIYKDSKFEKTSENNNRNKEVDSTRSKTSKIKNMKSVKAGNQNVSILKPLNEKAKKFKCFYCPMQFNSLYKKRKHLIQHKETKSTCCVLCKSTFSSVPSLRKHLLMVHCKTKNRKKCSYCNYRCFQNSDLEKHIARRHTRDFKYKCSYCVKGYTTPKELKIHVENKHKITKLNA